MGVGCSAPCPTAGPPHRRAGIDQKVDVQVLLLFVELDEKTVEARIDIPVDRAEIIAEGVIPVVGEFEARAGVAGAALGTMFAAKDFPREHMELIELREKCGIKKKRRSG